jgi:predicted neutral ceramidase superfamily lipid hydrolase
MVSIAGPAAMGDKAGERRSSMSRLVSISVLMFWSVLFGGLAHISMGQPMIAGPMPAEFQFNALLAALNAHQLMAVMVMIVAALFFWAAISVAFGDAEDFRIVETTAYVAGVAAMIVALVSGFVWLAAVLIAPTALTAALAASAAASHWLPVTSDANRRDMSISVARRMAISAAHNSMLSRIGGRPADRKG